MTHAFLQATEARWAGYAKSPRTHRHLKSQALPKVGDNKKSRTNSPHPSSLLDSLTVSDLVDHKKWQTIQFVSESDTIAKAIETLSVWRTTMAIVKSESSGEFIGTIDIIDLVALCHSKIVNETPARYEYASLLCLDELRDQTVSQYLENSHGNHFVKISMEASLRELISILSKPDIKRVVVLRKNETPTDLDAAGLTMNDIVAIISLPHVVDYLLAVLPEDLKAASVQDCFGAACSKPVAISADHGEFDPNVAENRVKNDYEVAMTFQSIWSKQCCGTANVQGYCFLDKLINWLVQIMKADLASVESVTVSEKDQLADLLKVFTSNLHMNKALITNEENQTTRSVDLREVMQRLSSLSLSSSSSSNHHDHVVMTGTITTTSTSSVVITAGGVPPTK